MNTFLLLCIAGILVNSFGIAFDFYFLNLAGAIILTIGTLKWSLCGTMSRKAKRYAIISIPFSLFTFVVPLAGVSGTTVSGVLLGINTFFYIYFTYYFTESLIESAKSVNELAITRNFRPIWTLCGIVAFLYFMAYTTLIPILVQIARIILLMSCLYYCFSMYNASRHLFIKK